MNQILNVQLPITLSTLFMLSFLYTKNYMIHLVDIWFWRIKFRKIIVLLQKKYIWNDSSTSCRSSWIMNYDILDISSTPPKCMGAGVKKLFFGTLKIITLLFISESDFKNLKTVVKKKTIQKIICFLLQ